MGHLVSQLVDPVVLVKTPKADTRVRGRGTRFSKDISRRNESTGGKEQADLVTT